MSDHGYTVTTAMASTDKNASVATKTTCPVRPQQPSLLCAEWRKLALGSAIFVAVFALPLGVARFDQSLFEAIALTRWYAQEHFLLCLVPAFFIAGAIAVFISQNAVMMYLGPHASKPVAYGVASVSGSILAVCSCTVLPLFAGIWRMGAGLGPATAFLYSGPAINVLAIVLTASVLGPELGAATENVPGHRGDRCGLGVQRVLDRSGTWLPTSGARTRASVRRDDPVHGRHDRPDHRALNRATQRRVR